MIFNEDEYYKKLAALLEADKIKVASNKNPVKIETKKYEKPEGDFLDIKKCKLTTNSIISTAKKDNEIPSIYELFEMAHPKSVHVGESEYEGGLVENIFEQQQIALQNIHRFPNGFADNPIVDLVIKVKKEAKNLRILGLKKEANQLSLAAKLLKKKLVKKGARTAEFNLLNGILVDVLDAARRDEVDEVSANLAVFYDTIQSHGIDKTELENRFKTEPILAEKINELKKYPRIADAIDYIKQDGKTDETLIDEIQQNIFDQIDDNLVSTLTNALTPAGPQTPAASNQPNSAQPLSPTNVNPLPSPPSPSVAPVPALTTPIAAPQLNATPPASATPTPLNTNNPTGAQAPTTPAGATPAQPVIQPSTQIFTPTPAPNPPNAQFPINGNSTNVVTSPPNATNTANPAAPAGQSSGPPHNGTNTTQNNPSGSSGTQNTKPKLHTKITSAVRKGGAQATAVWNTAKKSTLATGLGTLIATRIPAFLGGGAGAAAGGGMLAGAAGSIGAVALGAAAVALVVVGSYYLFSGSRREEVEEDFDEFIEQLEDLRDNNIGYFDNVDWFGQNVKDSAEYKRVKHLFDAKKNTFDEKDLAEINNIGNIKDQDLKEAVLSEKLLVQGKLLRQYFNEWLKLTKDAEPFLKPGVIKSQADAQKLYDIGTKIEAATNKITAQKESFYNMMSSLDESTWIDFDIRSAKNTFEDVVSHLESAAINEGAAQELSEKIVEAIGNSGQTVNTNQNGGAAGAGAGEAGANGGAAPAAPPTPASIVNVQNALRQTRFGLNAKVMPTGVIDNATKTAVTNLTDTLRQILGINGYTKLLDPDAILSNSNSEKIINYLIETYKNPSAFLQEFQARSADEK